MRREPEVREPFSRRLTVARKKNPRIARKQEGRKSFLTAAARYL
jgi:hypothetical protein